nr:immunoglobulin light chain junction region [Macaca mulatta]
DYYCQSYNTGNYVLF